MLYNGKPPYMNGLESIFKPNMTTQEEQLEFLREGEWIRSELAKRQIADQEERAKRPLYKRVLSLIPWIYN